MNKRPETQIAFDYCINAEYMILCKMCPDLDTVYVALWIGKISIFSKESETYIQREVYEWSLPSLSVANISVPDSFKFVWLLCLHEYKGWYIFPLTRK